MPNAIKYSTSAQTLALKKGNFWIGTGDSAKGPTSVTDYWNGISPSVGGYTIYLNKGSNGPSIYAPVNDSELISYTNLIAGASYTTVDECFLYYSTQTDKMVFNADYPAISTNGLSLNLDAGFRPSYPATGSTWYDLCYGGTSGTLINDPSFNSDSGGSIVFDGSNDYVSLPSQTLFTNSSFTIALWIYPQLSVAGVVFSAYGPGPGYNNSAIHIRLATNGTITFAFYNDDLNSSSGAFVNDSWQYLVCTYNFATDTSTIYVNGVSKATGNQGPFIETRTLTVRIGNWFAQEYYRGRVSSLNLYNRALTETEILQNYNAQLSRYVVYDASALAYITAAGFTNTSLKIAINNFFIDLKATGHYSKFIIMRLYITDSTNNATALSQMAINAVNPGTFDSTYFNAPTTSYSGMTMNGTSQYGLLNFNYSTSDARWGNFDASLMSYVGLSGASDIYNFGLRSVNLQNCGLGMTSSTGNMFTGINDSTAGLTFSDAVNNADGWRASSRTANDSTKYYIWRTTSQTQTGVAVQAKANINAPENAYTTDGTTFPGYFNQRLQFMAAASGISAADLITIGGIVNTFQGNLDTVFGLTGVDARKRY